jgi:hypothetical protein
MRFVIKLVLLVVLAALPLTVAYAHGGDEEPVETTAVVVEEDHSETPMWSVLASLGLATVATGGSWTVARKKLTAIHYGIIVLMVTTGVIHLILGMQGDTLLLLNGTGYLGLVGLRFLPILSNRTHLLIIDVIIIAYTLVTLAGYFALHSTAEIDTVGLITKGMEVLLIVAIGFNLMQSRQPVSGDPGTS